MSKTASILLSWLLFTITLNAQENWKLSTRMSFYTSETSTEALLVVPVTESGKKVQLTLSLNGHLLMRQDAILNETLLRLPFSLDEQDVENSSLVIWIEGEGVNLELKTNLVLLPEKPYGVKIDRLTGGLHIDDRPYYPVGFYCYSPVQKTLAEEEVVKGFNMMSPYQKIIPQTVNERIAYMDRCALLGMKVHYNLLSVAGGGGVGSARAPDDQTSKQKRRRLEEEILRFKDHPALLGWYISDEPTGHGEDPDSLKITYELIKSIDPYHPISIVFMAPAQARKYADAMDIVMADPYPVPNQPIRSVGTVIRNLKKEFFAEKAVWIVPQAFGGAEHWGREPSLRELRAMTWLAVVEGATGVQHFVRHGPNGFPKSTATWGECGKMALEIQEILPYLTEGELMAGFSTNGEGIRISAREHNGELLIIAVNEENVPKPLQIRSPFSLSGSRVDVLFENRQVKANGDGIQDIIDGYGTRVYRISGHNDATKTYAGNLIQDSGFENAISPGVPAACYASVGRDKGATYFLDTSDPYEGRHSLRMVSPADNQGVMLSLFPVRLNSGTGYTLSIWARIDANSVIVPSRTFWQKLFGKNKFEGNFFNISAGDFASEEIQLTSNWTRYKVHFQVPADGSSTIKINPSLELISQGVAWFDMLELYPDPMIEYGINTSNGFFEVSANTSEPRGILKYTLDGQKPEFSAPVLTEPLALDKSVLFTVGLFIDTKLVNVSSKPFLLHLAIGKEPKYSSSYTSKYSAGGTFGLVDGIRGSRDYLDGNWQGFMHKDMELLIDLDQVCLVQKLTLGCLQDTRSWIFMPTQVEFWGSVEGKEFVSLGKVENDVSLRANGAINKDFELSFDSGNYRYIRVNAKNIGVCPDWHNGKGQAAFLFVDEIVVE
ncbi:MAG: hypothetical protein KAH17_00820 [Bacteroidales bacterium]|nr:hypothetical protein [Bacteroidales bacterium]